MSSSQNLFFKCNGELPLQSLSQKSDRIKFCVLQNHLDYSVEKGLREGKSVCGENTQRLFQWLRKKGWELENGNE